MIGCQEEADEIARWDVNFPLSGPIGWRYLGEGSTRKAYLSPSGVVYKLQIFNSDSLDFDGKKKDRENEMEWEGYLRCKSFPLPGWRPAETYLYHAMNKPIIAMEYVKGEYAEDCERLTYYDDDCNCSRPNGLCVRDHRDFVNDSWGLMDGELENVIQEPDGTLVLIDMVC